MYFIMVIFVIVSIIIFSFILKSPFKYPYFIHKFDVSGKRKPQIENYIDYFFNEGKFYLIEGHNKRIKEWNNKCNEIIENSIFKNLRRKQYEKCLDDINAYKFVFYRKKIRYRQKNYKKYSYEVNADENTFSYNYDYLLNRYNKLKEINFESTLNEYNCVSQRRLMTKKLRTEVMIRDNYTCKKCGKYMSDCVGLQIDHIIPVSKGGKSVLSNLQVLCSKCNGSKSNKIE